ncbi:MAG: nucleotidyltransferase family protein [Sinobacterium sp.]
MKKLQHHAISAVLLEPKRGLRFDLDTWQSVILVLREEKLLATLYHLALETAVFEHYPEFAQRHLYSASIYARRQSKQIFYEALLLQELLEKNGVTPIFLKGANYTLRSSRNSQGRICSDIDVLVKVEELDSCESLLLSQNWKSAKLTQYDDRYYRQWAHEIPPLIHPFRGTVLDVHHNLYLPISGRSPKIELFINELEFSADNFAVLKIPQTVMHSIIHLFMNENFSSGMRDLFDIYRLIEEHSDESFWKDITVLARQSHFLVELQYCLVALETIFSFDAPEYVSIALHDNQLSWPQKIWAKHIFVNAILPQHPLISLNRQHFASSVAYFRGHWVKMPKSVLAKHFVVKLYNQLLDQVLGKHQLDPKQL